MLTVVGLVIALVIVNSSKQQTVVAPLPSLPEPTSTMPAPTTTSRTPDPCLPAADAAEHAVYDQPTNAGRDRNRRLQRRRRRPGHQHHLRRHRWRVADRVQRDAAVEQRGRAGPAGRGLRQRQHHQRRPRGDLLDHRQRRAGAAAHRRRADDLHRGRLDRHRPAWHPHRQHRHETRREHQQSPPMPARSAPKTSTNMANINGARNATARPVMV